MSYLSWACFNQILSFSFYYLFFWTFKEKHSEWALDWSFLNFKNLNFSIFFLCFLKFAKTKYFSGQFPYLIKFSMKFLTSRQSSFNFLCENFNYSWQTLNSCFCVYAQYWDQNGNLECCCQKPLNALYNAFENCFCYKAQKLSSFLLKRRKGKVRYMGKIVKSSFLVI